MWRVDYWTRQTNRQIMRNGPDYTAEYVLFSNLTANYLFILYLFYSLEGVGLEFLWCKSNVLLDFQKLIFVSSGKGKIPSKQQHDSLVSFASFKDILQIAAWLFIGKINTNKVFSIRGLKTILGDTKLRKVAGASKAAVYFLISLNCLLLLINYLQLLRYNTSTSNKYQRDLLFFLW